MADDNGLPTRGERIARALQRGRLRALHSVRAWQNRVMKWRTALLSVAGYTLLAFAAAQIHLGCALAVAGVSCFLLDRQADNG